MTTPRPGYFSIGSGPPVVLLHCSLSSKNQWRGLGGILAARHRVIAVDLYGYGETAMPDRREGFTLAEEVELVQALLAELMPKHSFHLVGHSYGGAVALNFWHHFPGRVTGLTLFEPVAFHLLEPADPALEPVRAMVRELAGRLLAGEQQEAARTFVDYWSGAGAFAAYPSRVQSDFARRTGKLLLDFQALTLTPVTLKQYAGVECPMTVIAGKKSKLPALRVAEKLSETVAGSKLQWVETGHMGPVTDPEPVNDLIMKSLT